LKKLILAIPVLFFVLTTVAFSQVEGDRVVAIAGNEIITESDFQYQVQLYAKQNQLTEISPFIAQQVFQSMLTNKILLAKADQDSIIITDEEVNGELDTRIKTLIGQVGSQQRLEELYGMSLIKIKTIIRSDLQDNMKVEKLKREKFQRGVKVSDREVRDFYKLYKDSLPDVGEEIEVAHIVIERKVSDAEIKEAKRIAQLILDSVKMGVDFSELAKRNSEDSMSALVGGDLGYAKKGTFVKEFEETVFSMKVGDVSELVETQFGYHIIKLNEKQGDKLKSQHILVKFPKLESSDFETINFLNGLKLKIESDSITFEAAAKEYSQDESTKGKGGYLGRVPSEQIDSITVVKMKSLSKGQITDPARIGTDESYGYEIYKFINIFPPHKLNINDDYDKIKRFTTSYKENTEMNTWLNEIRETIYVDVKM